jgi:transposase
VYWIPLYQILETRGVAVCLVNARHVKNVPGRKTDVQDCQWLQYLHAVGLLRASFRPPETVCAVRSLLRHRDSLVQLAATHTQHLQKALTQMNLQIHHVLSDITGVTGLAILDAILAGERDPQVLAGHRDRRIKASSETIAKALVGDYRSEHLFTLRQSLAAYRHYQQLIGACDAEVRTHLGTFASQIDPAVSPLPPSTGSRRTPRSTPSTPRFDLRTELYRILGTDLTQVPGLQTPTVHAIFSELGADLSAFPSGAHFASWLGLCPDNRISGQARRPQGDHGDGTQARADRLSPAHDPAALRGEPPRGGGSRPPAPDRIPAPRPGPGAGVSAGPCHRTVSFLKASTQPGRLGQ